MVLLTMTPSMVGALEELQSLQEKTGRIDDVELKCTEVCQKNEKPLGNYEDQGSLENRSVSTEKGDKQPAEPSLSSPKVGNPISHGQVIDISRQLNAHRGKLGNLEALLRGSNIYVPPPPPKAEPVSDILYAGWVKQ